MTLSERIIKAVELLINTYYVSTKKKSNLELAKELYSAAKDIYNMAYAAERAAIEEMRQSQKETTNE